MSSSTTARSSAPAEKWARLSVGMPEAQRAFLHRLAQAHGRRLGEWLRTLLPRPTLEELEAPKDDPDAPHPVSAKPGRDKLTHGGKLPRSASEAYDELVYANGLELEDYRAADNAYRAWLLEHKRGRYPGRRPPVWQGGELDPLNEELELRKARRLTSPLEGWVRLLKARRARTWEDALPVIRLLGEVRGFENIAAPAEVLERLMDDATSQGGDVVPF